MRGLQGRPGIKANVGRAGHERVFPEASISGCILDKEDVIIADGVRAERVLARSLLDVEAVACLDPLALAVHKRQQRDRLLEHRTRQRDDAVKARFWWRIQNARTVERDETLFFVLGVGRHLFVGKWVAVAIVSRSDNLFQIKPAIARRGARPTEPDSPRDFERFALLWCGVRAHRYGANASARGLVGR